MEKKKVQIRPLQLSRETLRQLDSKALTEVAGASFSWCPTFCQACHN